MGGLEAGDEGGGGVRAGRREWGFQMVVVVTNASMLDTRKELKDHGCQEKRR